MTAMPQMVALFNGVGGGAAALIALADFHDSIAAPGDLDLNVSVAIVLSALIGSVSFAGSMIAFAKLQELMPGRPITYPGQKYGNLLLLAVLVGLGIAIVAGVESEALLVALILGALAFGVLFVLPIGGADMPVVISLLNAFTGIAASATGFVAASDGADRERHARRRGGHAADADDGQGDGTLGRERPVRRLRPAPGDATRPSPPRAEPSSRRRPKTWASCSHTRSASSIVPGYGLAVAQAQHAVRELADELDKKGVDVRYAIHPVAGRMPGHMNVLLAEANVPYDQLHEMDEINPAFEQTDVALVIGANDVTNPAARNDPGSPIYGMPILNVDHAKNVVVLKRSMSPGFAGIDNPLFVDPKTVDALRRREGFGRDARRRRQGALMSVPLFAGATSTRRFARTRARGRARRVRRVRARRVDDAAEGLRARLSGRATSARCRRSAAATRAEVGDLVPGQPGTGAADGHGPRAALGRRGPDGSWRCSTPPR